MSDIRLYIDEDAEERALVEGLRSRGIDVHSTSEADMVGRTDREQLRYAVEHQRTIYSLNVGDFARLHKEYCDSGEDHFGIVVIPKQRYDVGEKIRRLADLVDSKSAEEMHNQIAFL
jgi:hypothetical protein